MKTLSFREFGSLLFVGLTHVFWLSHCPTVSAVGGPENLLLVVNRQSQNSIEIANHYVTLRDIPDSNVVYLDQVPGNEVIALKEFKEKILSPILSTLKKRHLTQRIDTIVYSADFPTGIGLPASSNKHLQPDSIQKYFKARASINGATYFAQQVLKDDFTFINPAANFYFRLPCKNAMGNYYNGPTKQLYGDLQKNYLAKEYERALELSRKLIGSRNDRPIFNFWASQCLAQLGRKQEALKMLQSAIDSGWHFSTKTKSSNAFKDFRGDADFQNLLAQMKELDRTPRFDFTSSTFWRPNGFPTTNPDEGRKYFLSMILGVTRGKGNSTEEVIQMLTKSVSADGTQPAGTFYFVSNKEIRTKTRAALMPEAIDCLEHIGKKAEMIESKLPVKKQDVLGAMIGTSKFKWQSSGSSILPGAICDNLTSYGGVMTGKRGEGQTTISEFVAFGSAGTSGTVIEPYTIPQKFPHPLIHYYYAQGSNIVESFYQATHGPYQLLMVGDPLCRPFAGFPDFDVQGVVDGQVVTDNLMISIENKSSRKIKSFDLYFDGRFVRNVAANANAHFNSKKVLAGYHEFRIVAHAGDGPSTTIAKTIGIKVQHGKKLPELREIPKSFSNNDVIELELASDLSFPISVRCHGREIPTRKQNNKYTVACSELGNGPILLRPSLSVRGQKYQLKPIRITIND